MLVVDITGTRALEKKLSRMMLFAKDLKPFFRLVGQHLRRSFTVNMTAGKDPNGRTLPPVAQWTRVVSGYNPGAKVLHRTGTLRRSIGPLSVTNSKLVFGFHGKQSGVAIAQTMGTQGRLKVSATILSKISKRGKIKKITRKGKKQKDGSRVSAKVFAGTNKQGIGYIRINTGKGWRTKRIINGEIAVKPRARRFFFLGAKDIREINRIGINYFTKAARS